MTRGAELTGRHVLWAILGFFGVVFFANGVFVYFATHSWTGLDTENAYVRGLGYNQVLDAAEAQRDLGWQVQFDVANTGDRAAVVTVTFADAGGRPVDGLSVAVEFRRPATEGYDQTVVLEPLASGEYGAKVDMPFAGNWDARMAARYDRVEHYILERRVWIE